MINTDILNLILESSTVINGQNSFDEIINWVSERNSLLTVNISKIPFSKCDGWYYDEKSGLIHNERKTFFSITGYSMRNGETFFEQPMLIQDEIGYLGILCKPYNGVLHFLMQAKIEPGNINCIQISPTIQATKSNFTQQHGGKKPPYLDYFLNANPDCLLVDQIQSEQSSRFLGKRNRNTIIILDQNDDVELLPSHKWMTLGQIKKLMKIDNLVNMDTRTVLSCIPYSLLHKKDVSADTPLLKSVLKEPSMKDIAFLYRHINNYKMFDEKRTIIKPLFEMENWEFKNDEYVCKLQHPFKLVFCDIEIEGREVRRWCQPLFEAVGKATFGLIYSDDFNDNIRRFLVKITPEIGCFDKIEIGPTIQHEAGQKINNDCVTNLFYSRLSQKVGVKFDQFLSEEGGRFYHEENRNVLMEIEKSDITDLPQNYFWCDYSTLNHLCMVNNCLNIQLRNLLSLIEITS